MRKLSEVQIAHRLKEVPHWERRGDNIVRTFKFRSFVKAIEFVNNVAPLAEKANHHPDMTINYNRVTLSLTTHDAGGLTERDFKLAKQIDEMKP